MIWRIVIEEFAEPHYVTFQAMQDAEPTRIPDAQPRGIVRYTQTVDTLDLKAVMKAVNQKPRAPRKSRSKAERAA